MNEDYARSFLKNGKIDRSLITSVDLDKRLESNLLRESKYEGLYLGEIVEKEKPEFGKNNLILAPVGSGKSFLIEKDLIPEDYSGKILYLTSNTSLKDSLAPNDNEIREILADDGQSVNFFTTENKKNFGDSDYSVHVMTYHEFGNRIYSPNETFTDDIDLIFCDEIHSLPLYNDYGGSRQLETVLRWIFTIHEDKTIYHFTATSESLENLEKQHPGYLGNIKVFDYLEHKNIRRYEAKSTYYIRHLEELRKHLLARIKSFNKNGYKALAFTRRIEEQHKIIEIAEEEGYKPIALWSINNKSHIMDKEQLFVREYLLSTGNIPDPYNLLVINSAMQEGWNLFDNKVELAILDTTNETERVQALGRIRKDIDFLIIKAKASDKVETNNSITLEDKYLEVPLTTEDKRELCEQLNILDVNGRVYKWRKISEMITDSGYKIEHQSIVDDGKRRRVSFISYKD